MWRIFCIAAVLHIASPAFGAEPQNWVQDLTSADIKVSMQAAYTFQPRKAEEAHAVSEVLAFAQHNSPIVRAYVASFLGEHRVDLDRSIPALVALLGDPDAKVRSHAAIALAEIGPTAVRPIMTALDKSVDSADYGYAALYEIGPAALPTMFLHLAPLGDQGRGYVTAALTTLSGEARDKVAAGLFRLQIDRRARAEWLYRVGAPMVPPLVNRFRTGSAGDRSVAALSLSLRYIHDRDNVASEIELGMEVLNAGLTDEQNSWKDRSDMALTLRSLLGFPIAHRSASAKILVRLVSGPTPAWKLRESAAIALDALSSTKLAPLGPLVTALRDPATPWPVRSALAATIGSMGPRAAAAAPDLEAVVISDAGNTLRLAAARSLGKLGPPGVERLAALLENRDEATRLFAVYGLTAAGSAGAQLLVRAKPRMSPNVQRAVEAAPYPWKPGEPDLPVFRDLRVRREMPGFSADRDDLSGGPLCQFLTDSSRQYAAAQRLFAAGVYHSGQCESMAATVLKDRLIAQYADRALRQMPDASPWSLSVTPALPPIPTDSLKIAELMQIHVTPVYGAATAYFPSIQPALPPIELPTPSIRETIPLNIPDTTTLESVFKKLQAAIGDSTGFGLYAANGGFTLITRVEQIDPDWKPLPGEYRWRPDRPGISPLNLAAYFHELLFAPPGEFRMVAFMVTTEPNPAFSGQLSYESVRELYNNGAPTLPACDPTAKPMMLSCQTFKGHFCHVLIYNYKKPVGKLIPELLNSGAGMPGVRAQLEASGIWSKLPR